jgi:hypothetical protein
MEFKSPIERDPRQEFIDSLESFNKKELIERLILMFDDLENEKRQGELKNAHISEINARLSLYEKLDKAEQKDES